MKKNGIFIIALILMAVSTAAWAEVIPGVYSLTPYVGYYKFEGNEGFKDTYSVGLRLGLNLSENIGLDSFLSLTPTEINEEGGDNVRMWSYGMEGIYNFMPDKKLVPFVAVGLGGIYYDSLVFTEHTNKFFLDYGAGVKYFLNEKIALRADVRHVIPISDNYNDFLFAFGVSYAFGQKKKITTSASEETYVPPPTPAPVYAPVPAPAPAVAAPAPVLVVTESPASAPVPAVVAPAQAETPVTVVVEEKEARTADEEDVKKMINKWRESWQSGDMQTYRACYAPDFQSKEKNLDEWISYKTKLQRRSKNIKISIDNLIITPENESSATALFTQTYSSSILKDSGEKTLKLIKINKEWKIYDEMM
jgi:outer membrane beta-barrel protein